MSNQHPFFLLVVSTDWASLVAQKLKRLSLMWETQVLPLGREDPLEKEMVTCSSILAWRVNRQRSLVGTVYGVAKSQTQLSN